MSHLLLRLRLPQMTVNISQLVLAIVVFSWFTTTVFIIDSYRRQLIRRINFLEIEVKRAEDLQISFRNFKETYQEELWAKIPLFAAEMEQDIKDDLQAGLWDLVNSSSIDLGVQIPVEIEQEEEDDYNSEELKDPNCPWYEEDNDFEQFDTNNVTSKINTQDDKFLLGVFPYGPNNQMRGFRDTITLAIKLNRTVVLPKCITRGLYFMTINII